MAKSQLETLIEISEDILDQATKNLGQAIHARDQAVAQLGTLEQYRNDYQSRLVSTAERGLTVTQFANFQGFIEKLDQAIVGQKKVIIDAEYKVERATREWQECEKKRLSYQTLSNRQLLEQQQKISKREQKETDELALKSFFYKK